MIGGKINFPKIIKVPFSRNFRKAAVTGSTTTLRADDAGEDGSLIRPDRHLAAVAVADRVGGDGDILGHIGHGGVLLRPRAMEVPPYEYRAATRIAGSVDLRTAEEPDLVPQNLHRAAALAGILAGHIQCAAVGGDPGVTTVKSDCPVLLDNRTRPNYSFVINYVTKDVTCHSGGKNYLTAIGGNGAAVLYPQSLCRSVTADNEIDQITAGNGKSNFIA